MSKNREDVVNCIAEMFNNISRENIEEICNKHNWNVDECIDYLIAKNRPTKTHISNQSLKNMPIEQQQPINDIKPNIINISKLKLEQNKDLIFKIKSGFRVMVILRGAPGSGKSTLAKSIIAETIPSNYSWFDFVLSSDDYFYDKNRIKYLYDIRNLQDAHAFNQRRVEQKAMAAWSPIIIDNTNMQLWEMLPYIRIAVQYGYLIDILEPSTDWRWQPGKLAQRNTHNVPKEKIERMISRYEKCEHTDVLIKMLKNAKYSVDLPQMRSRPPIIMNIDGEFDCVKKCQPLNAIPSQHVPAPTATVNKTSQVEINSFKHVLQSEVNLQGNDSKNDNDQTLFSTTSNHAWEPFELESSKFWNIKANTKVECNSAAEHLESDSNLLDLLKEGVHDSLEDRASLPAQNKDSHVLEKEHTFQRHCIDCPNEHKAFSALRQIYPNKEVGSLWDLFVKCNGDIDWAVDILLKEYELSLNQDNDQYVNHISNQHNLVCDCSKNNVLTNSTTNSCDNTPIPLLNPSVKPQRLKPKTSRNIQKNNSQDMKDIIQIIENRFVLGEEHYSNHTKKVRDLRNGILETVNPSKLNCSDAFTQTEMEQAHETCTDNPIELIELELDEKLIQQLSAHFKEENVFNISLPNKGANNIFMPRNLAKELYILYVESVYNQIEEQRQKTLREDENFARLIKNPKYEDCQESPHNVEELLDMELAWIVYSMENKNEPQKINDLAQHLTEKKLFETFPDIPQETLLDILAAHGNRFGETIKILQSTMQANSSNATSGLTQELLQRAASENEKLNLEQQQIKPHSTNLDNSRLRSDEAKHETLRDFEDMRNMAAHHSQLKTECYQKAKEAIQKGNGSVALYYSQIAELHTKKIDLYNQRAASYIMDVHKYTQSNPDLLDLHYLHLPEAIGCLDIFIDRHITDLRSRSRPYKSVFIITGRGLHSAGGVSVIKTKVKSRLKERSLRWTEINPGLLKVKLYTASRQSKNVS